MNRKQRRAMNKISKKQNAEQLNEKMMQFDKLPNQCSACTKPYDKKDKQMAMTWNVVVREKENIVRLYCPDCWQLANDAIKTFKEEIENVRE
tara:strand:- start:306 stop:581 length:276 start_codon:yes stop_codon:yes gene_type:complete